MKQAVLAMANLLMAQNGKTTTLEVKNSMYAGTSYKPKQSEISNVMAELYVENSWNRNLNKTNSGIEFYEYSDPNQTVKTPVSGSNTIAGQVFGNNTSIVGPAILNQVVGQNIARNNRNVTITIPQLDPKDGSTVCYISGKPEKYVQAHNRREGRKACFNKFEDTEIGLIYDNINNCSVEYFNKHKAS